MSYSDFKKVFPKEVKKKNTKKIRQTSKAHISGTAWQIQLKFGIEVPNPRWKKKQRRTHQRQKIYRKRQKFQGWKVSRFAGFIRYVGKVLRFFHHYLHTFMLAFVVFQLYKTAVSVSTKVSRSSREFSLKLSLVYLEMDESTLLTQVCADSRMTMQLRYWKEKSYSWSESEMKQIANHFLVSFFCKLLPNLLAERFFATTVEYFSCIVSTFSGVKVKRENFRGLLKIRENCKSFFTVKLLSFTVSPFNTGNGFKPACIALNCGELQ